MKRGIIILCKSKYMSFRNSDYSTDAKRVYVESIIELRGTEWHLHAVHTHARARARTHTHTPYTYLSVRVLYCVHPND
jgi:hypothetical protein